MPINQGKTLSYLVKYSMTYAIEGLGTKAERLPASLQTTDRTIGHLSQQSILSHIGNTPLIALQRIHPATPEVRLYGKAEWYNPTGSVKDRAAISIITAAERDGSLTPAKTILDATSGNAGISYAMIAAALGYRVKLAIPKNVNAERKRILTAYGVELVQTDPLQGSDGAIRKARETYSADPSRYFYADQYSNEANWRAHYETTGVEIWSQTAGAVTHLVAGVGTGGTLMGAGKRLREYNPKIEVIALQPDSSFHGLEGLKHMATSIQPKIYDPSFPDDTIEIGTEEAQEMVRRLAREEGILVGPSSGAAVVASIKLANEIKSGTIVTVFPDCGGRYLSEQFWKEGH